LQTAGLAMAVDVFDNTGQSLRNQAGELVCTNAFPSMPLGFYQDDNDELYHKAYFSKFNNVWAHGDWVELNDHGGFIFYGRSDATLNPAGVRIGTAEIYSVVDHLDEIKESIVVGQEWKGDTRIVLFIVLADRIVFDEKLNERIKRELRENYSPRHVPAKIIVIDDIPRTRSGKIAELAVQKIIHGQAVDNREALANPESLTQFANRCELDSD